MSANAPFLVTFAFGFFSGVGAVVLALWLSYRMDVADDRERNLR